MKNLKSRIVRIDRTKDEGSKIFTHVKYDIVVNIVIESEPFIEGRVIHTNEPTMKLNYGYYFDLKDLIPIKSVAIEYYNT